ncbi:uncharacterized protein [Blastocystis hominis]|uniref:Legumain n=1 Tax=Blastocystis hominis TaxID=12968 RepID=D8M219_BLAHO|nr:uncharacterized protein [Blastocystis hominis]CBK22108.2 unnamed protein product [Blastocystis hominis]|eukprot:XP_012896156.1 uncharacterized protein [Blastocystis hominis]
MKFSFFVLLLAIASASKWAVLLAGSSGYGNYRHQSDVAHMYGILIDHKFDPDHIITIMYGDLPDHPRNPFSGTIFNHPGNNQRNYQEGLVIDYDHKYKLTKELYLNILLGDSGSVRNMTGIENPKVLKTNKDDHIFLYYIDHGGDNIVAMPDGDYLTARELVQTIQTMYDEGKYGKLVYYLEACESGSMWQTLPNDINAYALSSTLPNESSWGTYCPPNDDVVDGVHIGSCLGEVWSCFWLEQDDAADLSTLTLQKQFDDAKDFTTTSHPLQFGDMEIAQEPVGDYISEVAGRRRFLRSENRRVEQWDSRLNDLLFWKNRALDANDREAYAKYMEIAERNLNVDRYFKQLVRKVMKNDDTMLKLHFAEKNWPCYNAVLEKYQSTYGFNDYSMKYARTLANMCTLYKGDVQDIINAM